MTRGGDLRLFMRRRRVLWLTMVCLVLVVAGLLMLAREVGFVFDVLAP